MVSAAVLQAITPTPEPPSYPVEFWTTNAEGERVARVDRLVHRSVGAWDAFVAGEVVGTVTAADLATPLLRCGYWQEKKDVLVYVGVTRLRATLSPCRPSTPRKSGSPSMVSKLTRAHPSR